MARFAGRILAYLLLLCAFIVLLRDGMAAAQSGAFSFAPLGAIWYALSPGSLNGLQAGVERYVAPWLWESVIFPVLQWPAFAVFLIPGVVLWLLCRGWLSLKGRSQFGDR